MKWLLILACLGCGMMAGLFAAFSTFMMTALGSLKPAEGIRAMQAINRFIVRPGFLLVFLGTAMLLATTSYLAAEGGTDVVYVSTAALLYILTCVVSTIVFNIPLNNELERADPDAPEGEQVWLRYLVSWTRWNHVRAIACVLATLLVGYAIAEL